MQPNTAMQPTPSVWPILILCGISGAVVSVMPLLFCRARLMASRWTATNQGSTCDRIIRRRTRSCSCSLVVSIYRQSQEGVMTLLSNIRMQNVYNHYVQREAIHRQILDIFTHQNVKDFVSLVLGI